MNFEFLTATRIIFGPGAASQAGKLAASIGKRVLVASGVPDPILDEITTCLVEAGLGVVELNVQSEPTTGIIQKGVSIAREENCDLVFGLGGGSAIDTGKAVAALLTNPGDLYDYLEVVGRGQSIRLPSAPLVAIPTTAGTGAEVTSNTVISATLPDNPGRKMKVSLRSSFIQARLAIVDPELTLDLPAAVTASTGLDALTQLIEPYVSNRANPLTDALCREGLRRAAGALRTVYFEGGDLKAREEMSLASLLSGIALANAKLGAVHGLASSIGGIFSAPHGSICARLLPFVMQTNIAALRERQEGSPFLQRYQEVAQILTRRMDAAVEDGLEWIQRLVLDMHIPGLSEYGINVEDIPELVNQAERASSMQGNPIRLSNAELSEILHQSL